MTRRRLPGLAALIVASGTLGTSPAAGQVLRGTVVGEGTGVPLRGAVVTILGANGTATDRRTLTDAQGGFAMRAPAPGSWMVEARAIGYSPRRTTARAVQAGETVVERIVLRQVATRLAALRVEGRTACRRAGELDAVTTEVWDDIWAALAATDIAREQRLVRADVFVYTREADAASGMVLREERGIASVLDSRPFQTEPASELVTHGFWRALPGEGVVFHGLDAATLIAAEFLATHCFSLVRSDTAGTTRVGLAFRPVNARARADVEGVLWLDAQSRELRQLEFRYTGLQLRGPAAGGRMSFMRLSNGLLVDDFWSLQHPYERTRAVGAPRTGRGVVANVTRPGTSLRMAGGFVLTDSSRAGHLSAVTGIVRQGTAPADAVSVELLGSGQRFVTDSTGLFLIRDVLPGTYEMRIVRPGPADRGGFVQHGQLTLAGGDIARVEFSVPSADSIARELCPGQSAGASPLFVLLREEHSGRSAPDYRIEVRWEPPVDSLGEPIGRAGGVRALTDWRGEFVACNVPDGASASFRTTTGDAEWSLPIRLGRRLNVIEIAADTSGRNR